MTVTAARMAIGSLAVIAVSLLFRRTWRPPAASDWPKYGLFGLIAAAHFGLYIASLSYTTIAHSLSITYTAPIWVSLCAWICLGEPLPRHKWPGVLTTVIGIAILTGFEPMLNPRMILGDSMALGSAICFGFYSVAGRSQRGAVPLFTYSATVYGIAALWLALPGWLQYEPGTLTWTAGLAVLGASVFPLAIGHTMYNAALRRIHPTIVNIIATQEVSGGVILGAVILGEVPAATTVVGVVVALGGVAWTLR